MLHYNFHKNKRVLLIYRNGHKEVARWWMADGKFFKFVDREPVRIDKLRSITIYREPPQKG